MSEPAATTVGPMSGNTIGLVLGSSVLAAAAGAYLQSNRQREERFRDRMITEAIDFLTLAFGIEKQLIDTENDLRGAHASGEDSDTPWAERGQAIRDALDAAWDKRAVLAIVFPDGRVETRAQALLDALEKWYDSLRDGSIGADLEAVHQETGATKNGYATVVQEAIRRRAFRSFRLPTRRAAA